MRHAKGVLVPTHCREVEAVAEGALAAGYPSLPDWFLLREDTFMGRTELPPVAAYRGLKMWEYADAPEWDVFQAEWAALKAADLVFSARAGRLLWISQECVGDMETIGVGHLLGDVEDGIVDDLKALLNAVKQVDWEKTSQLHRRLPAVANGNTPVFQQGGDWVPWDAATWSVCAEVPQREGEPAEVQVRALVRQGRTGGLTQEGHPHGMEMSRYTSTRRVRSRTRPQGTSIREMELCARVIRACVREDKPLSDLLDASGVQGGCAAHPLALLALLREKLETTVGTPTGGTDTPMTPASGDAERNAQVGPSGTD